MTIRKAGNIIAGGLSTTPPKTGTSAPTTSTIADYVGQIYLDTTNNKRYICTAISSGTYTWTDMLPIADTSTTGVVKVGVNYGTAVTAEGLIYTARADSSDINAKSNNYKPIVPSTLNYAVRSVRPAYTEISATASTYTLANNNVYGQIPSQGVTYTLPTVVAGEDNWCKVFVDTTTTASIAFDAGTVTINPNGTTSLQTGHKYIIICQYNNLKAEWEIYIIDGGTVS